MKIDFSAILIVFSLFGFSSSYTQDTSHIELFVSANNNFETENYTEAINQYTSILESGRFSPEIYFNLGNAYLKKGDIGMAILNYERAKRLDPSNKRILSMLSIARNKIDSGIIEVQDFFLVRSWHALSQKLNPFSWMVLQLLFGIAFIYSVYKWKFSDESRIRFYGLLSAFICIFLLGIGFLAGAKSHKLLNGKDNAIIMKDQVLMSGPDSRSKELNNLSTGEKVIIIDEIDTWFKVKLINREIGWIPVENIVII